MSDRESVPDDAVSDGSDAESALSGDAARDGGPTSAPADSGGSPAADHQGYRMPFAVRAAQVLAVGLAVVGAGCAATSWWLSGPHAAMITGASFVASWLLGVVALAFGAEGGGIRITAVLLAVLNALWTVPSILVGRPPGWVGPVVSVLVIGLLLRRSAREWFEP
ncbi:hypothetical protein [Nocardia spumae]|uniref:hypothetical protein n=1 Tax=Nocardia spumae TaxID=2887190 RepID=UPI001D159375|nr:hypothetical protein [Nocardia spumae]